jgi:hypothetical protein
MMCLDNFFRITYLDSKSQNLAVKVVPISNLVKSIYFGKNDDTSEDKGNEQSNTCDASMKHPTHKVKHTSSADKVP